MDDDAREQSALDEPEGPPRRTLLRNAIVRAVFFVIVVTVAVACLGQTRDEVMYFLTGADEPSDLGDLRALFNDGNTPAMQHNSFVKASNLVMVDESGYLGKNYFFCPLYNIVVRTSRPLPNRTTSSLVSITPAMAPLIAHHKMLPDDLSASFSVEGRLLRVDRLPAALSDAIVGHFGDVAGTDKTALWLLLDGDAPSDYHWYPVMCGLGALAVALSGFFLIRAVKRLRQPKFTTPVGD